jgi:uncharacterized protein
MSIGLILLGAITGFVSAFFGIGGSSIDTPLLRTFFNFPPYLALGTPLPLAFITVICAFFAYKKIHLVNFKLALVSLLGGLPGIIAGSYFSPYFPGKFLMLLTALILFLIGLDFIYEKSHQNKKPAAKKKDVGDFYIFGVAFFIGLLSGILANGGGIFFVPFYALLLRVKIKEAIATSLFVVAFMSIPASIVHYTLGHIDLVSTATIGIGVIPLAYLGARLDLRTNSKTIEFCFGALLILFSFYFFVNQLVI